MADKSKHRLGEGDFEEFTEGDWHGGNRRRPLRRAAMAQLPPGKQLTKGDVPALKQAILDGLTAHPDLFTSLLDMQAYLKTRHGVSYTIMRLSELFRELGVGVIDGYYTVLPMHLSQGDAWDQLSDDLRVYLANDPLLKGDVVILNLRGGVTFLVDQDLTGVRMDPGNNDHILAVTTGWEDVVVQFRHDSEAKRFWAKCMKAHRPNWDDPSITDPKSVKDAILALLKKKGVIGEDQVCKELEIEPADFRLLMDMLMKEQPITRQGKAYSLMAGHLFWQEKGVGGRNRSIADADAEDVSESETEDGDEQDG